MRYLASGLLALVLTAAAQVTGAQTPSRLVLFFVDDLHMDFRDTPRLRMLIARLGRELGRDGDQWAMATTGHSSVSVAPNADWNGFPAAVTRITAGGLKPGDRQPEEVAQRARIAASTAAAAIRQATAGGRPLVVLYVSSGYVRGVASEFEAVSAAASQAGTPIFAVDLRRPPPQTPAEWDAFVAETQESLRVLAVASGGMTVFTDADIETMLTRLK